MEGTALTLAYRCMLHGHEVTCRVIVFRDLHRRLQPEVMGLHVEEEGQSIVRLQRVSCEDRERNRSDAESSLRGQSR